MIRILIFLFLIFGLNSCKEKDAYFYKQIKTSDSLANNGLYFSSIKLLRNVAANPQISEQERGKAFYKIGYAFQNLTLLDSAQIYYGKGDEIADKLKTNTLLVKKYNYKSSVFYTKNQMDSAVVFGLKAIETAELTNNNYLLNATNSNLGRIFIQEKNKKKAKKYLDIAMTYAKKSKDSVTIIETLICLAQLNELQKKYNDAEKKYKDIIKFSEANQLNKNVVLANSNLAKIYLYTGKLDKAKKHAFISLGLYSSFETANKLKAEIEKTNQLAKLNGKNESINNTEAFLKERDSIIDKRIQLEKENAYLEYLKGSKKAIDANLKINSEKDIRETIDRIIKLKDSIYYTVLNSKYLEFETKFQTEKTEKQNQKLRADTAEKIILAEKRKNQNLLLLFILTLLLFGIILFYKYARNKKAELLYNAKLNIIKARQNEQDEIGKELHDSISKKLEAIAYKLTKKGDGDLARQTTQIKDNIKKISKELSVMSFQESPFQEQLTTLAATYQTENTRINISGIENIDWKKIAQPIKYNLFLVIREAVSNSSNYAKANNIDVHFNKNIKNISVNIKDDGIGFDKKSTNIGSGFRNMKVRVKDINGDLKIISEKNRGTIIAIQFVII
ncbi:ATP-binding protein [uncultured Lacinutrix sp.]|uniref:ATP-binding protein n=1 Tax=uncultured Lacinutrix sp. TaxID=574032 RepID=UPI00261D9042|nr:ATP-binding protein [uncultured Lacinutrix sp.]